MKNDKTSRKKAQTLFPAGVFTLMLALVSWTGGSLPPSGDPVDVKEHQRMFEMQLAEMYNSEVAMAEKLGELVTIVRSPELKEALEIHRKETAAQGDRLKMVFAELGSRPLPTRSAGFEGILADNDRMIGEFKGSPMIDAVVIAGSRKVEHFEMACYMNLIRTAEMMELKGTILDALNESLKEEEKTEQLLARFAGELKMDEAPRRDLDRTRENTQTREAAPATPTRDAGATTPRKR